MRFLRRAKDCTRRDIRNEDICNELGMVECNINDKILESKEDWEKHLIG